jgi:hypothetical protein
MQVPKDWRRKSLNALHRAKESGVYSTFRDNRQAAEEMAKRRPGIYPLLFIEKFPENHIGYNPSLAASAYDKKAVAIGGFDTLGAFAMSFTRLSDPYHELRNGPVLQAFGDQQGFHVEFECRFPEVTFQQHIYLTETDDMYIVAAASSIQQSDIKLMQQAISTLCIKKPSPAK